MNTNRGDIKIIEARIARSCRIAFAAALVIALFIPVAENILKMSTAGALVIRSIDVMALFVIAASLVKAFLLNLRLRRLQKFKR